ncbi:MAG: ubiquinone anaerobic biosynthesis protein UbiV [Methylovirgula sp.]
MASDVKLTLGPLLFNWPADMWSDFYARIADEAPVDRVVIGELTCSKRLPHYADRIPAAVERLQRAGKTIVFASLILVTLERERRASGELLRAAEADVEINDLTLMNWVDDAPRFSVGPFVNVYNEATLALLARKGAYLICVPPELPFSEVETLAKAAADLNVDLEVWAYGRVPLAISARCYHARAHGLAKDSCQFVCGYDLDGRAVDTIDGQAFLAINGVQTLSHNHCNLIRDLDRLTAAGVRSLRLSPHSEDLALVAQIFRDVLDGRFDKDEALRLLQKNAPDAVFSNGFMFGSAGAEGLANSRADPVRAP